jgi:hypothetical protein
MQSIELCDPCFPVSTREKTPNYYEFSLFDSQRPSTERRLWKKLLHSGTRYSGPTYLPQTQYDYRQLVPEQRSPETDK